MRGDRDMIIRRTTPDDTAVLRRLAALDDAAALRGDALVAEVDGEIAAAISLSDGRAIADPFRHTAELVELLRMRAAQLTEPVEAPRRRGGVLARRATARA
jgi:hypothetical protein